MGSILRPLASNGSAHVASRIDTTDDDDVRFG